MGVLINDCSTASLRKYWVTLHAIAAITAVTGFSIWFCTPFFTRNVRLNRYHQFFRWSSVAIALVSGGGCLGASIALGEIEPKIKAIEKYDQAQFKHSVATELFLAQQTNSAITQSVVMDRKSELGLNPPELPEESYVTENENPQSYEPNNETNGITDEERDKVAIALQDGLPDSEIVKSVLRSGGSRYREGKARLEKIKSELEAES